MNAFLARTSSSSPAYLWDAWYGYVQLGPAQPTREQAQSLD